MNLSRRFEWRVLSGASAALAVVLATSSPGLAQTSLAVSETRLAFTAVRGGDAPPSQHLAVTSAITERIDFTSGVEPIASTGGGPAWLAIGLQRGTTPARLRVSVDQSELAVGDYSARVVIRSGSQSIPVSVALSVAEAAPRLQVAPAALRFDFGADVSEQFLFIRNAGGRGALPYRVTVAGGADWLSVSPAAGETVPNRPSLVRVAVNPGKAGEAERGAVRVQSGDAFIDVPVSAVRLPPGPVLGVNLTGLKFEARENQGNANNRNVLVLNLGEGSLSWQADVLQGGEWLTLTTPSGRAMPNELGRLGLNVNPGALAAGSYYGLVRVSAPSAAGSPQYIGAVLNVSPAADLPALEPSPQGLFFVGDPGQPPPPNQPIRVFVSSRQPVPFQAAATTADGAGWLQVEPVSGVSSTDNPTMLRVTVNPANLKPGVYTGDVTLAFADRTIRTTNITLVAPGGTLGAAKTQGPRLAASCTPTRLSLTQTGVVNNFSSPAGWPSTLIVRLADDCGEPVLNASVVSTFSNSDPPLSMPLTNAVVGLYSAAWLPRGGGNVVVTTTASAPGLGDTRAEVIGSVTASREAPVLYPGAVLSNFNPEAGAPLAPGSPAQLFGSSLSATTAAAAGLPLPSELASSSMLIGPNRTPLYFVSPGQMNIQIPPELATGRRHAVAILAGNRYTVADPIALAAVRPALIATEGIAIAQHADSSTVSSQSPARAGEEITLLATGLGATDPAVAGGAVPPPGSTARVRIAPSVTIGGRDAAVREAALAPDGVGIYQVKVQVPSGLAAGSHEIEIVQQGVASNRAAVSVAP